MVRRIANQVHKQAARLLRSNYIQKEPVWFQAVLEFPPIPLPPRAPPRRSHYDLPNPKQMSSEHSKPFKRKLSPIIYLEDRVRRQFFHDHPFEAFRERTLLESGTIEDDHPIRGQQWTRLSQRGRNPTPEDAVRFAVDLHIHHAMPLTQAYAEAVMQFRSLRSEHHIATAIAVAEAEAYGSELGPLETEKAFEKEEIHLRSWETQTTIQQESSEARKRWKAIVTRTADSGSWTRGQEYVRLWKEGIRPNYAPHLTAPVTTDSTSTAERIATGSDFMDLQSQIPNQRWSFDTIN